MNIFFLDKSQKKCAKMYHDAHLRKIIVEIAQMLSTACHYRYVYDFYSIGEDIKTIKINNNKYIINNKDYDINVPNYLQEIYKPAYINHPMTKWVRETEGNFVYARTLFLELCKEFYYRFGKAHKSAELFSKFKMPEFISLSFTEPPQCMPEKYRCDDYILAYRKYYIGDKLRDKNGKIYKWTNRNEPEFIKVINNGYV
jgi:hypothetical protein